MKMKVLSPGVKNGEEADRCAQTLGITRNREQGFRYGSKQQGVDHARILQRQSADLLRQREYDVEIRNRQHLALPGRQPLGARGRLTLGAVSVAARIIRDDSMPARIALLDIFRMSTESGRAAVADRGKGFPLMSAEHVAPSLEELFFAGAEDIGHFEPMLAHRSGGVAPAAGIRSSEPSVSSGLLVERTALSER